MADEHMKYKLLELLQKTGYEMVQHNGQRKFGPPPNWTGPPPQKGCEVFVGKLPREIFEDELVPIFSSVGKIYEMRLMMDFSGSNRGYAFVTYCTRSEAYRAVKELNGYEIRPGRHLGVVKSVDNCRLFIGGIPKTKTREDVYEALAGRVEGIVDVILYKNCFDRNLNRGFAFVEFTSHRAAAMARRTLIPGCVKMWDQEVMVDWAEPEPDVDDEQMQKHLQKQEFATSPKEDEGIGSGYAGSTCGSLASNDYTLAPAKLDSMCKRYMWPAPVYKYQKYYDAAGVDVWVGCVELSSVGAPLVSPAQRLGPLMTRGCYSLQQAHVEAAENALHAIKLLRADMIQRSSTQSMQPMYPTVVPQIPSCIGVPCNYMNSPPYSRPPTIPMTVPAVWRTI